MGEKIFTLGKKKVRTVSWMPGWMLTAKGLVDSKFGEKVCSTYLEMLHSKMMLNAQKEDRICEEYLKKLRVEAKELVYEMQESQKKIMMISDKEGDSVEIARANLSNATKRNELKNRIERDAQRLVVISEELLNIETCLSMYIYSLQLDYTVKTKSYIKGIRAGKFPDFQVPDLNFVQLKKINHEEYMELKKRIHVLVTGKEDE